ATAVHPARRLYGEARGWHVAQDALWRADTRVFDLAQFALPGAHNARNACAALGALEILGGDAVAAAPALARFRGLPHRLQWLGARDAITWIDDSISTTPEATRAALESLPGAAVTLILGGHERGLDWAPFAAWLAAHAPHAVIAQGANAARIAAALHVAGLAPPCADDLEAALRLARTLTAPGGVVLLRPARPASISSATTPRAADASPNWPASIRRRRAKSAGWVSPERPRARLDSDQSRQHGIQR
ncbi:UDP-N-acetylmuramoyl-L-alanyl-D-glutamate synthetase, partial [mine drainage metagenome]